MVSVTSSGQSHSKHSTAMGKEKLDVEKQDEELFALMSLSNITMDPEVFSVVMNLFRNGVSADAVFVFLTKAAECSKLGRKLSQMKSKHKKLDVQRREGKESRSSSRALLRDATPSTEPAVVTRHDSNDERVEWKRKGVYLGRDAQNF